MLKYIIILISVLITNVPAHNLVGNGDHVLNTHPPTQRSDPTDGCRERGVQGKVAQLHFGPDTGLFVRSQQGVLVPQLLYWRTTFTPDHLVYSTNWKANSRVSEVLNRFVTDPQTLYYNIKQLYADIYE